MVGIKCVEKYKQQMEAREYNQFQADYNAVIFEFENMNYIEAITKLNNMLGYINDMDYYIKVKKMLGKCYLLQADKEHGEQREVYLNKIILLYKDLLSDDTKLSENQIFEIQCELLDTYYYYDDEEYVDFFEEIAKKTENGLGKIDISSPILCDKYVTLGRYYFTKFLRKHNYEDIEKAKEYYTYVSDFKIDIEIENWGHKNILFADKVQAAEFFRAYAINVLQNSDKEYRAILAKAVLMVKEVVSFCSYEQFSEVYFQSMQELGHCYMLLYDYENAYDCFKKFIYMDDVNLDRWLEDTYKFVQLDLNQEDIKILLTRYQNLIDYYDMKSNIIKVYKTKLELMICYYCLYEKQNGNEYYNKAKELSKELYAKYYGYFDMELDRALDNCNKEFSE
jgi:tetratricopeptide (TPR) repeat protein